jgi:hypothetical protein
VSAAFCCTLRGVSAAERTDCGVEGLSGESERARSVCKTHNQQTSLQNTNAATLRPRHTCSPCQPLAAALNDLFLELADSLGVLLVALLAQLSNALHKIRGVDFFRHDGGCRSRKHAQTPYDTATREGDAALAWM